MPAPPPPPPPLPPPPPPTPPPRSRDHARRGRLPPPPLPRRANPTPLTPSPPTHLTTATARRPPAADRPPADRRQPAADHQPPLTTAAPRAQEQSESSRGTDMSVLSKPSPARRASPPAAAPSWDAPGSRWTRRPATPRGRAGPSRRTQQRVSTYLPGARLMLERRRTRVTRVNADPPGRLKDGSCSWLVPTTGDWSHRARVLGRASRKHPRATNQEHAFHVIAGILT